MSISRGHNRSHSRYKMAKTSKILKQRKMDQFLVPRVKNGSHSFCMAVKMSRRKIIKFVLSGVTSVQNPDCMENICARTMGYITSFLRFKFGVDSDSSMWLECCREEGGLGVGGDVALSFHPYILRYITLSLVNLCITGQFIGNRQLHTGLEGCVYRAPGCPAGSMQLEQMMKQRLVQPRSMFIVHCDTNATGHNGAPQFLINFGTYAGILYPYFIRSHSGVMVSGERLFHDINDVDLHNMNKFISAYTTIHVMSTSGRVALRQLLALRNESGTINEQDRQSIVHALDIFEDTHIAVPLCPLLVKWVDEPVKAGIWLYWTTGTPIRWTVNDTDSPFVAVKTSLFPASSMHPSSERCRLREFKSLRVNGTRFRSHKDDGTEARWVEQDNGRYEHPVCIGAQYNKPTIGTVRAMILGVDPANECASRWSR